MLTSFNDNLKSLFLYSGFDIDFRTIQRQTADANINDGGDDNRYFSDSGNTGNFNSGNVQN